MILELVNPSDKITFVGDDPKVAGVAILLLGNGWYGLTGENGERFIPLMIFGSHEPWLKEQGIADINRWIMDNALALAEFLETVAYGSVRDRRGFDEAVKRMTPEKAAEHRAWWNDRCRSSMTDIGGGALKLAAQLRKFHAREPGVKLEGTHPLVFGGP
jgi:hypothetical protein